MVDDNNTIASDITAANNNGEVDGDILLLNRPSPKDGFAQKE
jgi:hypothetical protein